MTQIDPVLDTADTHETWGVYERQCTECGKLMLHVATTHAHDFGYMEDKPLCSECEATDDGEDV